MALVHWLHPVNCSFEGDLMSIYESAQKARDARYNAIKHLAGKFEWSNTYGYAKFRYEAKTTDPEARSLSAHDVMLLADGGNICFGGRDASKREAGDYTIFYGIVHTD